MLVPCVSRVQRCCSLRLRGIWLRHRKSPAIFRIFAQSDLAPFDRNPPPPASPPPPGSPSQVRNLFAVQLKHRLLPPVGGNSEGQKLSNKDHNFDAVLEMIVLSHAAKLSLFGGSTFSYVAHGARGGEAKFVDFKHQNCHRRVIAQPCYHLPFRAIAEPQPDCPAVHHRHPLAAHINASLPSWEIWLPRKERRALRAKDMLPLQTKC